MTPHRIRAPWRVPGVLGVLAFLASATAALPQEEMPSDEGRIFGPLPIRSVDSLSLLFHQAPLDTATTLGSGKFRAELDLQYGSHENAGEGHGFSAAHDDEVLRWEIRGRYGLTDDLEVCLSFPLHFASSGFLDGFISSFHQATGLGPTNERDGLFVDSARFQGREFAGFPEDHMSLGDLPLTLKLSVLEDGLDPIGIALRGSIELPTGHTGDQFGSGRVDGGLGIVAQKTLGNLSFFGCADGAFQDNPALFEHAGVEVKPVTANAAIGVEWRLIDWLALATQLHYGEALIKNGGGSLLARERLIWALGAHAAIGDATTLRLGIMEDVVTGPVADVAFLLGMTMEL